MKNKKSIALPLVLIVVALVLINVLSETFSFRLDFTEDKMYTLSTATKDIVESLEEPVTVTAYFTEGSHQQIEKARQDFKDLLIEYSTLSGGMLNYEFLNPNKDPQVEQQAREEGIQPVPISVREKDKLEQQIVYLGAKITMGEKTDIIPVIQPGAPMEYTLSSSIKKLSVNIKPTVGFLQGHSEPSVNSYPQALQQLQVLYEVQAIDLNAESPDLQQYKTVAIIAPSDSFPESHFVLLDQYLANGGNLYVAYNQFEGDFQSMRGNLVNTNFGDWLETKGLKVENNCVVDASAGTVGVRQQNGYMTFSRQIPFPYWPLIRQFNKEIPITKGLEQVMLQLVSTINYTGDTSLVYTPFLMSSEKSGTLPLPVYFNVQKKWGESDFPLGQLALGAILEGPINGETHSSIVLIGDGDFAINGEGQEAQQRQADNISLMVNAIDFLSDDTGLIDLRTKEVTSRPLEEMDDAKKAVIKWLNFALPLLLVIIYGIIRLQLRRRKRTQRMEEGYV